MGLWIKRIIFVVTAARQLNKKKQTPAEKAPEVRDGFRFLRLVWSINKTHIRNRRDRDGLEI